MCGITGWVNWEKHMDNEVFVLNQMTDTLLKRGPDEKNVWFHSQVAFGHTRLAVVDPQGGRQPMSKTEQHKTYTIVYNGELYNTDELRAQLNRKGYSFKTASDTEVLLTSYMEWRENCVHYLNGIYAFGIWDHDEEKLFMARDRLGVKPLFYMHKKGLFLFGSEIKALLKHPSVKSEVSRTGLAEIFGLAPARTPGHGIFKDIQEVRPAHALVFSKSGLKIWRYWNVNSEEHKESFRSTVEHLRFLFMDTVERQLVADVPLSTFLSGGLDSSAITAIAAKHFQKKGQTLHTFSIDYHGNEKYFQTNDYLPSRDQPFIELMAETFSTTHHYERINEQELADDLKEAVVLRDFPGMADIDSSLLWFCRRIKQHSTVSLSGECADEIFGGYPWFRHPDLTSDAGFPWMRSLQSRIDLLEPEWQQKLNLKEYVQSRYQETIEETPLLDGETEKNQKRRELFYLNMQWFMAQLLERKDRMSMGASLEVRVPFADHRLVEYVWNIPWEMKMYNGREKGILRKALEPLLPEKIVYRKKSPYPKTYQPDYTKRVVQWMETILEDRESPLFQFVQKNQAEELVRTEGKALTEPWFGQLMTGPQLIAHLCQIDYWLREYNVTVSE
ncbi:asparagine synthase (glutamine-hydrolysing) [Melghiribacillus thermohalophilus]|uniref:asparagine synthase (glutamine-hydrolyzing) n=1 Tax=Melghiribacillus thermohalophilus TaxID=1324956 RepID=A0A4R3MVX0_9BACI|nr:asparagine synthase (glutamine-hydrolyzing) [Melghiribacillus thermohalophilus]TCT18024.1 asparagine synthase (glutamine-hydrolysing) [Melghiribacillus thermohalophilus]